MASRCQGDRFSLAISNGIGQKKNTDRPFTSGLSAPAIRTGHLLRSTDVDCWRFFDRTGSIGRVLVRVWRTVFLSSILRWWRPCETTQPFYGPQGRPANGWLCFSRPTDTAAIDRSVAESFPVSVVNCNRGRSAKKKTNSATSGKSRQNPDKTRYKPGNTPVGPVQSMKKKDCMRKKKKLDQLTLKANSSPASRLCCV